MAFLHSFFLFWKIQLLHKMLLCDRFIVILNELVNKCLNFLSLLLSSMINSDRYNSQKTKALGDPQYFSRV